MTPHRVHLRGLTKRFGPIAAVTDLSFSVEPGRVTGFLGPNGSGKTTTLRILLGLVRPTAGTATVGDGTYRDLRHPARTVGAVLEASNFHPGRTARDHLRVYGDMIGADAQRVASVMEELDVTPFAHRKTGTFSTGMRQRLNLATALLGDPPVLILDEPSNGLDPEGIVWLRRFLRGLAGQGRTVLVASHVLGEAEQLVDDVVIVRRGRLLANAPLTELTTPESTLEQEFLRLTGAEA